MSDDRVQRRLEIADRLSRAVGRMFVVNVRHRTGKATDDEADAAIEAVLDAHLEYEHFSNGTFDSYLEYKRLKQGYANDRD